MTQQEPDLLRVDQGPARGGAMRGKSRFKLFEAGHAAIQGSGVAINRCQESESARQNQFGSQIPDTLVRIK
jgi:hypothetical protein